MSKYERDQRVVLHDDGSATLPDQPGGNDGDLKFKPNKWGTFNAINSKYGPMGDPSDVHNRRWQQFDSLDEAIAAFLGDPQ